MCLLASSFAESSSAQVINYKELLLLFWSKNYLELFDRIYNGNILVKKLEFQYKYGFSRSVDGHLTHTIVEKLFKKPYYNDSVYNKSVWMWFGKDSFKICVM